MASSTAIPEKSIPPSENKANFLVGSNLEAKSLFQSPVFPDSYIFPYNPDDLASGNNYDIYDEMKTDDQVKAAISIKKDMVINTGWKIDCDKEEISEFVENSLKEIGTGSLNEASFEDSLRDILSSYEYGFSLTEPIYELKDGMYRYKCLKTRPPHTFKFNINPSGYIEKITQTQPSGDVDFKPDLFLHYIYQQEFGNPYGRSDLNAAHTPWKMKKFILKFYAMYLERWASPTVVGKYDRNMDANEVQRFHDMLKTIQTRTALGVPNDVAVELLYPQRDGGDAYQKAIDLMNMMIARSILVPDLLGIGGAQTKGGSFALGKEHFKVFLNTIYKDRQSLERKITTRIVQPLVKVNFGDIPCHFSFIEYTDEDISTYADIWVKAVSGRIFKPTEEEVNHFRSITGFPEGDVEFPEERVEEPNEDAGDPKEKKEDMSLKLFRETTGYEKKMDFSAVRRTLDSHEKAVLPQIERAAKTIWKDYISQVRDRNIVGRFRPDIINEIGPKFLKGLNVVFKSYFRDLFRESIEGARREILPNGTGRTSFVASFSEALLPEEYEAIFESEAFKTVKDYSDNVIKKGGNILINGIKSGKPESEIIAEMSELMDEETAKWISTVIRTKTTEIYNTGRRSYWETDDIAKQIVVAYQFSAILDNRTSRVCTELDQRTYEVGEDIGRITPPLHWNCRSLLVPITKFEEYEAETLPSHDEIVEMGGNLK